MVTWDKDRDSCCYSFTSYLHACFFFWNGSQPSAISRFPLHACKTCDEGQFETVKRVPRPMHTRTCSTISQWVFLLESTRNTNGSPISYNPLRGCFEQDRFTWKVLLQVFPGFERVLQAIQWHHNKPRKTCRTPAIPWPPTFTNAVCVLCLQPRISWSTCPTVSPLTYLLYFAWHFLLKTSLYPCFPIFQTLSNKIPYNSSNFPPKAAQGCKRLQIGASEKNRKAAVSARVPPGKLQFLQECFLHLEQSRFEAAPWENVRQ